MPHRVRNRQRNPPPGRPRKRRRNPVVPPTLDDRLRDAVSQNRLLNDDHLDAKRQQ